MTKKSNWKPIETAPKDGTPILVCGRYIESSGAKYPILTTVKWSDCWNEWMLVDSGDYCQDPTFPLAELWMDCPEFPDWW